MFSLLESALCLWIQVHPLWIQGLKRLVLWTQNLALLEGQGLWIQAIVLHCSCAKAASSGIRARFTFQDQLFKDVPRKGFVNPQHLFSYTSRNHGSDDRLKSPLVVEFSEFSGQLNIEEFLDWLIEVERFFEDRNIAKKKQVQFVCRKLKGVHGLGGSNCKGCVLG